MFRGPRKLGFLCLFFFISIFSPKAIASIFGTVRGIVHDALHRPIPGAKVELSATQSDWKRSTVTDAEGAFQIDAVPAGNYTIHISHEGFRNSQQQLVVLADTAPLRHFPLEVAGVNQQVEVHAEADQVDPTSSTSSATVTRAEIAELPGASRTNSLDFVTAYTPGAYMVHDQLHIRGGHQVSWLVDGIPVPNTNIAANVGPQFDPKDIDVVEIQRGGQSAEYGDRTYAAFNVIPRSGFERDREAELVATYGSYHATDSQLSFGDHTERFAWYASLSGSRSDIGLMPPEPQEFHDNNNNVGLFTSLIFNATPGDQLRFVGSARTDYFQIPNTLDQQEIGTRDVERERDVFGNFSWVHTVNPGVLFTVAPFFHWNRAAYDGYLPSAGFTLDDAPITTSHNDSHYEGGLASLSFTRGRHNAKLGLYGFAQQDDSFFRLVNTDGTRSIGVDEAEERVVLLREAVEAELCVMTAASEAKAGEAAFVVRVVVAGGDGRVVECESGGRQIAVISGAIPVEEWRDSKEHTWIDGVDPGEIAEDIAFSFDIARANFLLIERIGNLEIVRAGGANETELIAGRGIEDERGEEADVVIVVVKFLRFGRHEADVRARTAEAGIPGETFGVIAKAELAVGGVITAIGCDEFGFAVALEAGTGNYVECSVGAIAVFGGLAAALDFDNVNILGIELRADVCSDVRVGDGDAVHEPGNLMAAANVKLIVDHIGARSVGGNEIEAVCSGCAGEFSNFGASNGCGAGGRSRVNLIGFRVDFDLLIDAGDFEREVAQRSSVRKDDELLLGISEAFVRNVNCVIASGNGVNLKRAFGVGDGGALPIGLRGTEFDLCARNGAMQRIVDDAANRAKDAGDGFWRKN